MSAKPNCKKKKKQMSVQII